jgi:hypothetical protein
MNTDIMSFPKAFPWTAISRWVLSIGAAIAITNLGLPQPITGPLINALLILTVEWGSVSEAICVGMVTPVGAALRGILPLPLLVMIPFISLGNAILVGSYGFFRQRNRWLGLGLGASAKALFLYSTSMILTARPLHIEMGGREQVAVMPEAYLTMMSWPQWLTAMAGGLLAFGILEIRKRGVRFKVK